MIMEFLIKYIITSTTGTQIVLYLLSLLHLIL